MNMNWMDAVFTLLAIGLIDNAFSAPNSPLYSDKAYLRGLKHGNRQHMNPVSKEISDEHNRDLSDYRLPTDIAPTAQLIQLQPYIYEGNFTFDGYVEITIDCVNPTATVILHYRDLEIDFQKTTLEEVGGTSSISITNQGYDQGKEFYILSLGVTLEAGKSYILKITYQGPLNDFYAGCFQGAYIENGTSVYYAMSDFEPIDARNCFPCFDEPIYKINFTTQIIREDNLLSASNCPLDFSTPLGNGWTMDQFEPTVKMATYLNAFHVSDFTYTTTSSNDIDYAVYCRPGFEDLTAYALFLGPSLINEFGSRFQVKYAMPKLDQIALPEFNSGAMENYGFVTYIDYALLYTDVVNSARDKQGICEITSHELAHQWFGNYINSGWWTHVWLQEGFATYYEYVGCGSVEPDFHEDEIFLNSELHYILGVDDTPTINPLVYELDDPDDIYGMFNTITYGKGPSIYS